MNREEQLRNEISSVTDWLDQHPMTGSFVAELSRTQMERRLDALRRRLSDTIDRVFEMRFVDPDRAEWTAISSPVLSQLLTKLQGTLTFGTWAMGSGPTVQGTVPSAIEKSAATEVVATPEGSFRLVLRKQQLDINPYFDQSVAAIFDIASAATADALDEAAPRAQELGREATRRLELFFKRLGEAKLDTEMSWQTPDTAAEVFVDHATAKNLGRWLAVAIPEIEPITIRGFLRRADSLTGAFKIEEEATGRMYEGGGEVAIVAHAQLDALYEADILLETKTASHTGRVTEKLSLLSLTPL